VLSQYLGAVSPGTYVPLAVGVFIGGAGVLVYLLNYQPSDENEIEIALWPQRRQLALRIVAAVDLTLACLLFLVALILGGDGFVLTAGLLVILALGACMSFWIGRDGTDQGGSNESNNDTR